LYHQFDGDFQESDDEIADAQKENVALRSAESVRWSLRLRFSGPARSSPNKTENESPVISKRRGLGNRKVGFLHNIHHHFKPFDKPPQQLQRPATRLGYVKFCRQCEKGREMELERNEEKPQAGLEGARHVISWCSIVGSPVFEKCLYVFLLAY
jgi:hypothetical protein